MKSSLVALSVVLNLLAGCHAQFTYGDDCKDNVLEDVKAAAAEAIKVAGYSSTRFKSVQQRGGVPKGTLLQDMIRAPSETDQEANDYASKWLDSVSKVQDVKIFCSDKHLRKIGDGKYRDPAGGSLITLPRKPGATDNACGGFLRAFQYIGEHNHPNIILCSDSPTGALKSYLGPTFDKYRGQDWAGTPAKRTPQGSQPGLDIFNNWLSYKILHELFHCANMVQFPAKLPSGVTEVYGYKGITGRDVGADGPDTGLKADDLRRNADSMAFLACGWYIPSIVWKNGQARTIDPKDRPPFLEALELQNSSTVVSDFRRARSLQWRA